MEIKKKCEKGTFCTDQLEKLLDAQRINKLGWMKELYSRIFNLAPNRNKAAALCSQSTCPFLAADNQQVRVSLGQT